MCCFIKSQHLLYMGNIRKSYKNNKFEISAPTWKKEFELPYRPYSVSDIQDYFEYIV